MASYLNLLMYSKKFPNVFGGHLITMNIPSPRSDEGSHAYSSKWEAIMPICRYKIIPTLKE
jgi:hypothetical protein